MKHIFSIVMSLSIALSAVGQSVRLGSVDMKNVRVVTNEVDALAMAELNGHIGPRLDAIETNYLPLIWGQTNNWRTAYAWGNHAAAGYLPAASWQSWIATNTYVRAELDQSALSALAQYATTNRVSMFRDTANTSVWWVANGGTNLTSYTTALGWVVSCDALTIYGNPVMSAHSVIRLDIPHPLPPEGFFPMAGELTVSTLDGSITVWLPDETYWGGLVLEPLDSYTFTPGVDGGVGNVRLTYQTVTNAVASFNLTTGNVWQAVADTRQTAEDALLAADQASTLANYHVSQDGNPHPGKFAPAAVTNAPEWIVYTNIAAACTVTNQAERPVRIYGTGASTGVVSFAALREPLPLFFEASRFASLSFSNAYVVGGGAWQTNRVNLFIAFRSHTNTFVTPITTREP